MEQKIFGQINQEKSGSKKNIYLMQPTYMNSSSVHFPYAIGALASYAWQFDDIRENYALKKCFFLRNKTKEVLNSLENPFLVGFSCYMWNFEYNKLLAKKIKGRYPNCIIVFGGQHIAPGEENLIKYPFVDILMHNEGEVFFRDLLRALANGTQLKEVNNISFRENGQTVATPVTTAKDFNFPSPYESGFYDKLIEDNPNIEFIPLVETNRGCPNHCAYCSWGKMNAKVRLFPLDRVFRDLEWVSEHKMEFLGFADANFGMFPRDEQIIDKIIELYEKNGYPVKFQVSYSKNSEDRVFRITEKLNKKGMDKGVTLSFQSMSPTVQKNIGRSNMYIEHFKTLLDKYSQAGIPTYTDLILGLPGETLESFTDGIETLLEYGQHTSLFVHLCEWLPCAEMGKKEYMKHFGINYSKVPLNQPHMSRIENEEVGEFSRIITLTNSMSHDDWKKMNIFSACVLCFHHLGMLQIAALYIYHQKGIKYKDFYSSLAEYLLSLGGAASNALKKIKKRLDDIIEKNSAVVFFDDRFGNVAWPFEEYLFLDIITQKDLFFKQIKNFLSNYIDDDALLCELLAYQSFIIKQINVSHKSFSGSYNWKDYFGALLKGQKDAVLKKEKVHYVIDDIKAAVTWQEYARNVLWYGRRGGKNIYTSEIKEVVGDERE